MTGEFPHISQTPVCQGTDSADSYCLQPGPPSLSPVALPRLVPEEESLPTRKEVVALGEVQRELAATTAHGGSAKALSEDELDLLRGALSLVEKRVRDVMCPLAQVQ